MEEKNQKNPLIQINARAMDFIWQKVPKEKKDGEEYITYFKTDLPYMYYSGFVDAQRYTMEQWQRAFEDCVGEDGRLWVSYQKFISLGMFRYHKVLNEPFDPLKMREGKYQVDRLWQVFENSIIPSCSLPKEFLKNMFDALVREKKTLKDMVKDKVKEDKELADKVNAFDPKEFEESKWEGDSIVVDRKALLNLRNLLDTYPSPRRRLEMNVLDLRNKKLNQLADIAKNPQKSNFEMGKDFRETAKESLKDMLVKASANPNAGRKPMDEVIDLKGKSKNRPVKF